MFWVDLNGEYIVSTTVAYLAYCQWHFPVQFSGINSLINFRAHPTVPTHGWSHLLIKCSFSQGNRPFLDRNTHFLLENLKIDNLRSWRVKIETLYNTPFCEQIPTYVMCVHVCTIWCEPPGCMFVPNSNMVIFLIFLPKLLKWALYWHRCITIPSACHPTNIKPSV